MAVGEKLSGFTGRGIKSSGEDTTVSSWTAEMRGPVNPCWIRSWLRKCEKGWYIYHAASEPGAEGDKTVYFHSVFLKIFMRSFYREV